MNDVVSERSGRSYPGDIPKKVRFVKQLLAARQYRHRRHHKDESFTTTSESKRRRRSARQDNIIGTPLSCSTKLLRTPTTSSYSGSLLSHDISIVDDIFNTPRRVTGNEEEKEDEQHYIDCVSNDEEEEERLPLLDARWHHTPSTGLKKAEEKKKKRLLAIRASPWPRLLVQSLFLGAIELFAALISSSLSLLANALFLLLVQSVHRMNEMLTTEPPASETSSATSASALSRASHIFSVVAAMGTSTVVAIEAVSRLLDERNREGIRNLGETPNGDVVLGVGVVAVGLDIFVWAFLWKPPPRSEGLVVSASDLLSSNMFRSFVIVFAAISTYAPIDAVETDSMCALFVLASILPRLPWGNMCTARCCLSSNDAYDSRLFDSD